MTIRLIEKDLLFKPGHVHVVSNVDMNTRTKFLECHWMNGEVILQEEVSLFETLIIPRTVKAGDEDRAYELVGAWGNAGFIQVKRCLDAAIWVEKYIVVSEVSVDEAVVDWMEIRNKIFMLFQKVMLNSDILNRHCARFTFYRIVVVYILEKVTL